MKKNTKNEIDKLLHRFPELCNCNLYEAVELLIECYKKGKKVLVCGNGGSATDSLHIVGELMKGFILPRKLDFEKQSKIHELYPESAEYLINNLQGALPTFSLVSEIGLSSAFANDQAPDLSFAQQVIGYGTSGDTLIAISTSGNSRNVIYAAQIAKIQGMKVLSMTGRTGGALRNYSDVLINPPFDETYIIQEYHLPIYHAICAALEYEFFGLEV